MHLFRRWINRARRVETRLGTPRIVTVRRTHWTTHLQGVVVIPTTDQPSRRRAGGRLHYRPTDDDITTPPPLSPIRWPDDCSYSVDIPLLAPD